MGYPYYILDVFTEAPFSGNQLAVVRDCDGLSADQMQSIAREFNFSETVFVLRPADPVNSARLRIFTPAAEVPFAGHPTIGAAVLIAQVDAAQMLGQRELVIALELGIGLVTCEVRKPKARATRAEFNLPKLPQLLKGTPSVGDLARALNLAADDIGFDGHVPSHFSAGFGFVFVPVASLEAIGRAKINADTWDSVFSHPDGRACYLYTREVAGEHSHVHTRMFSPSFGINEDPATGSAAAAFAGVCMQFEKPGDGVHQIVIEQGIEMGRPSEIVLTLSVRDQALESASIGGSAVVFAHGNLDI